VLTGRKKLRRNNKSKRREIKKRTRDKSAENKREKCRRMSKMISQRN